MLQLQLEERRVSRLGLATASATYLTHLRSLLFCDGRAFCHIYTNEGFVRLVHRPLHDLRLAIRAKGWDVRCFVCFCAIDVLDASSCVGTRWCVSVRSFIYIFSSDGYV